METAENVINLKERKPSESGSLFKFEVAKTLARFFLIGAIFYIFSRIQTGYAWVPEVLLVSNVVFLLLLLLFRKTLLKKSYLLRAAHYASLILCLVTFSIIVHYTGGPDSVFVLFFYFYLVVVPLAQIRFHLAETVASEILIILWYPIFILSTTANPPVEKLAWQVAFEVMIAAVIFVFSMIIRSEDRSIRDLNLKLQNLAITDPLTGLYNRRFLQEEVSREIARAKRTGEPVTVAIGDLDDFKRFNDTYGHLKGDEILRTVAEIILKNTRQVDVAARYGGEEFVILLPGVNKEKACEVAERIRKQLQETTRKLFEQELTITFGIASYPEDGRDEIEIFRRADRALYQAKKEGKNRIKICKGSLG